MKCVRIPTCQPAVCGDVILQEVTYVPMAVQIRQEWINRMKGGGGRAAARNAQNGQAPDDAAPSSSGCPQWGRNPLLSHDFLLTRGQPITETRPPVVTHVQIPARRSKKITRKRKASRKKKATPCPTAAQQHVLTRTRLTSPASPKNKAASTTTAKTPTAEGGLYLPRRRFPAKHTPLSAAGNRVAAITREIHDIKIDSNQSSKSKSKPATSSGHATSEEEQTLTHSSAPPKSPKKRVVVKKKGMGGTPSVALSLAPWKGGEGEGKKGRAPRGFKSKKVRPVSMSMIKAPSQSLSSRAQIMSTEIQTLVAGLTAMDRHKSVEGSARPARKAPGESHDELANEAEISKKRDQPVGTLRDVPKKEGTATEDSTGRLARKSPKRPRPRTATLVRLSTPKSPRSLPTGTASQGISVPKDSPHSPNLKALAKSVHPSLKPKALLHPKSDHLLRRDHPSPKLYALAKSDHHSPNPKVLPQSNQPSPNFKALPKSDHSNPKPKGLPINDHPRADPKPKSNHPSPNPTAPPMSDNSSPKPKTPLKSDEPSSTSLSPNAPLSSIPSKSKTISESLSKTISSTRSPLMGRRPKKAKNTLQQQKTHQPQQHHHKTVQTTFNDSNDLDPMYDRSRMLSYVQVSRVREVKYRRKSSSASRKPSNTRSLLSGNATPENELSTKELELEAHPRSHPYFTQETSFIEDRGDDVIPGSASASRSTVLLEQLRDKLSTGRDKGHLHSTEIDYHNHRTPSLQPSALPLAHSLLPKTREQLGAPIVSKALQKRKLFERLSQMQMEQLGLGSGVRKDRKRRRKRRRSRSAKSGKGTCKPPGKGKGQAKQ